MCFTANVGVGTDGLPSGDISCYHHRSTVNSAYETPLHTCSYKVEWDAIGLEGYYNGGSPSDSLLYSSVDVQAVEISATKNGIDGHFSLAYRYAGLTRYLPR